MTIAEIYNYADKIGLLTFSTIYNDEAHSRIAHFNGYDDEGIYFRTMSNKPYGRQLLETHKVTVCGHYGKGLVNHDDEVGTMPEFAPGYSLRIIGDVRFVSSEEIIEKAKTNKMLEVAARDITLYPAMGEGNFMIYRAKYEIFDYDFGKVNRPYKLHRIRGAFGGATFNQAGVKIGDSCISCGECASTCSFDAIVDEEPHYRVLPERCDDCGSCIRVCPVGAIALSEVF